MGWALQDGNLAGVKGPWRKTLWKRGIIPGGDRGGGTIR